MSKILQFKITLQKSKPIIWRRFQVKDSITFDELHNTIQSVMGWTNSHLYKFDYGKIVIADPEMVDYIPVMNAFKTKLTEPFVVSKMKIKYEYDFGDGWMHELVLEKFIDVAPGQHYPFCMEGEMNCPPEDCGGLHGFYYYLEVLKDKKHPEYRDILNWIGNGYDATAFNLAEVNSFLRDL